MFTVTDSNNADSHLRQLRIQADLGLREVARELSIDHTRLLHWERTGRVPKSEHVMKLAELYCVGPEDIMGLPKSKPSIAPNSKMAKLFAEAAKLPRPKQQRVAEFLEDMLAAQKARA